MAMASATGWIPYERGRSGGITFAARTEGETVVVSFEGNVGVESSPAARAFLLEWVERDRDVLVDLRSVGELDSSAVAGLVEALQHAKRNGRRLALVSVNPVIRRALELVRLDRVFHLYDTISEAMGCAPSQRRSGSARP